MSDIDGKENANENANQNANNHENNHANNAAQTNTETSFLSRWSRRKLQANASTAASEKARLVQLAVSADGVVTPPLVSSASPEKLPTIESLTPQSDFAPFFKPEVDSHLKNQALKVLFKDPHYNVMDGLDIYIGDYSQPDPIPSEMLRQLNQAKSLSLFEDEQAQEEPSKEGVGIPAQVSEMQADDAPLLEQTEAQVFQDSPAPSPEKGLDHPTTPRLVEGKS